MRTTNHFERDVIGPNRLPKYEGITREMCERTVREAAYSEASRGERLFYGHFPELPGRTKYLRVVTDAGAETIVTAYKDRTFARRVERGEV